MNMILNASKYIFPLSFLLYVGLHLGKPEVGAAFVPNYLPYPLFWNYFTLVCILLFIVSAVIGKYDKLAYTLMAFLVHLPKAMGQELDITNMAVNLAKEKEFEMINFFRNIMITGALLAFAKFVAKDKKLIG